MTSSIESAIRELHRSAALFAGNDAPRFAPPASQADVEELGRALRRPVPQDVSELLRRHRAIVAMDVHNGYWIGGSETGTLALANQPSEALLDSERVEVVPVATDGGGNTFVRSGLDGTIWRQDREKSSYRRIAHDLANFLRRVAEDWVHASQNDPAWRYLV
jgi:hypothetical protein